MLARVESGEESATTERVEFSVNSTSEVNTTVPLALALKVMVPIDTASLYIVRTGVPVEPIPAVNY